jgi:hypothetical protein
MNRILQAQMELKFKQMKYEDSNCKFPPLYLGKKHGNTEEGGAGGSSAVVMGGVGLLVG